MAKLEMAQNPKRVRVFMKGGVLYEGGIEEAMGQTPNLGGYRNTTPTRGENEGIKEDTSKS